MKENKKRKAVYVLGGLYCGGTETFVMNMYRANDRDKLDFEFLIHEKNKAHYDDEVLSSGGKIYRIPDRTEVGTLRYLFNLIKILNELKPDIIHAHAMFNSGVVMVASYFIGIKRRVCHAHSSGDQEANKLTRKLFRLLMGFFIKLFSTDLVACNEKAAKYLYGKEVLKKGKVKIINNGIDLERYLSVCDDDKDRLRKELSLSKDSFIIGFVGRLVDVKNPVFIVSILEQILKINPKAIVIFVGEGPLKSVIAKECREKNMINNVRLLGNRSDIPNLMSIFDVFVLPSIFEGAPIVTIEAQAMGVPCIVSDSVPTTIDLGLGLINYIPLNKEVEWIDQITSKQKKLNNPDLIKTVFNQKGYDNHSSYRGLLKIYRV